MPENRKVGGSTPPLATTITAGQEASDLRFCHSQGCVSELSVAAIDRQIPRFAARCCTRCCTELRSESFGDVRPKGWTSPPSHGATSTSCRPTLEAEQGQLRFLDARIEGLSAGLDQARPAVEEAQTRLARARGHLEP